MVYVWVLPPIATRAPITASNLGCNATNLSLIYTFNTTPSGNEGGIWSCGMAPAADTNGNIYIMTGNGTFDGTQNFGMCMIKLSASLAVEDYATPTNWASLSGADLDFGSGGVVLLPPHYAVGIGKDTNLCMADIPIWAMSEIGRRY